MASTIEVHKQTVKQLLESGKDHPFLIPDYQRPYAWEQDQIDTLFDDLWEHISSQDDKPYFLGSIVSFENDEQQQEIIDGQQRITSLFLLLRAIYTKLCASEESKEVNNFKSQIENTIWRSDKYTGEVNKKELLIDSKVATDDHVDILKHILETGEVDDKNADNYSRNYLRFIERFENVSKDNALKVYDFIHLILNKAIVLPVTAESQDSALTIFSTLNNRGLPLSDADIFKAKIYSKLESAEKADFIDKWKDIETMCDGTEESLQSLFYYYMFYLRALDGDDSTTTPGVRKYFLNKDHIHKLYDPALLKNLLAILKFRLVITEGRIIEDEKNNIEAWTQNSDIKQALDILSSYPNEFSKYPVITYYLVHRKENKFEENFLKFVRKLLSELLLKYLESPTINPVKRPIVKLNVEICKTNQPIIDFEVADIESLSEKIKNPHKNAVRMLLKILAYEKQKELLPAKWEIEHIFPQHWHENYFTKDIGEDVVRKLIEHLGNKIPFEKRLNIFAGNGYFDRKKKLYKESKISITKQIGESSLTDWNIDSISERDISVYQTFKSIIVSWENDYNNTSREPTEEEKKMIEELKAKGLI